MGIDDETDNEMDKGTLEGILFHLSQDLKDLEERACGRDAYSKHMLAEKLLDIASKLGDLSDETAPEDHRPPEKPSRKASFIRVEAKCADRCSIDMVDASGSMIHQHVGEVPEFMPGQHYGDSIILSINVKSGLISNWGDEERAKIQGLLDDHHPGGNERISYSGVA